MSTNWYNTEQNLKSRRQALMAEAEQYRLSKKAKPSRRLLNFSFVRRFTLRLWPGSGIAQTRMNQQPAA